MRSNSLVSVEPLRSDIPEDNKSQGGRGDGSHTRAASISSIVSDVAPSIELPEYVKGHGERGSFVEGFKERGMV